MSDITMRGFFHLQMEKDGTIVGDSGWRKNKITNDGTLNFITELMASNGGSSYVSHAALGTGTVPGAAATTLDGEIGSEGHDTRVAVTRGTTGSTQVDYTCTFASSLITAATGYNIANIGLFGISQSQVGQIFAGNTFASSNWATNQNVNMTYSITVAVA